MKILAFWSLFYCVFVNFSKWLIIRCPSGSYKSNNICEKCYDTCEDCFGLSSN